MNDMCHLTGKHTWVLWHFTIACMWVDGTTWVVAHGWEAPCPAP